MPVYEYKCTACDQRFEIEQSFTDDPLTSLEGCEVDADGDHRLKKVFSAVGISFKGDGFYRNDSRGSKKSSSANGGSGSSSGSDSSSDSTSDSSSSSKSADSSPSGSSTSSSDSSTSSSGSSASPTSGSGAKTST